MKPSRKPYRKPFAGDPFYPLEIVHMATKHPQNELPDHLHDHCEIVYVYGGHGTFFIDDTFYDKSPGDLFLIPGNTIHRAFPDADRPILSSALFFAPAFPGAADPRDDYAPLGCFETARRDKRYKLEAPADVKADVERLLGLIAEEMRQKRTGYREAARLALGQLLLRLNRYVLTE